MEDKIWHKVTIDLDDQTVSVYPTDIFNGIIVEGDDLDGSTKYRFYLNQKQMEFLILKMREVMDYTQQKK